ncbi:MAG TPA: PIN domain-containing protein [Chromatiales bacterium]|nr:PIN domain-containing protein [Chromatiales bacterium]
MEVIVDTNIFLAVVLDESEKEKIIGLTAQTDAVAPEILPCEIANAVSAMLKRKQITQDEVISVYRVANEIPVRLVPADIQLALELAIEFNVYAYDAYFLQCALSLQLPMLTLGSQMKQVAQALDINLLK